MISGFPEEVIRTDLGLSNISVTYLVEERVFFLFLLLVAIRILLAGNFSVDCAHSVAWARAGRHRYEHVS